MSIEINIPDYDLAIELAVAQGFEHTATALRKMRDRAMQQEVANNRATIHAQKVPLH